MSEASVTAADIRHSMDANSIRDTRNKGDVIDSPDVSSIMDKNNTKNPRPGPKNTTRQHECIKSTLKKKKIKFYKKIQSEAVAKSYTRKGFLMYEEMRKYFPICGEAVNHI
jgi:hypothetical protein